MKKGFTLVELMVVISICLILFAIIFGFVTRGSGNASSDYIDWANPEYSRAMSNRRQAEALEEQNQLKREELELRRKELEKE